MRILHIFDHSLPLQSGYVSRSLGILRSQRERGWETIHVTAPRHAAWTRQGDGTEIFDGLSFHRTQLPATGMPCVQPMAEMRALRRHIAEIVQRERPDILHAHSPVLNVLPAESVARRFGLPVVYEVRAFWEDAAVDHGRIREDSLAYRLRKMLDGYAMRRADAVMPLCEPMRAEMIERGIPAERLTVVPNAIDGRFLTPPPSDGSAIRAELGLDGRFILGFIGSFYSYEGIDLLLEAAAMLRAEMPSLAVLLVGGGPEEARLRALVEKSGLQDVVRMVSRVSLDEVPHYYQAVDLFVFPRRKMRLTDLVTPLKPLEAMAQRRPVAASNVGGHRELIRDGETGLLFPPDDSAALAAALRKLIADPATRARITENGRRYVERDRSWQAISERYATVYARLLGGKGAPAPATPAARAIF
jgi:PEP-CTERM/exosortase A-associated glycosyltransferase